MPERTTVVFCVFVLFAASPALGQYPVPFELYAGMGVLNDRSLSLTSPTLVGGMSWDYHANWWWVPVFEGEWNMASRAQACRRSPQDSPDNCVDGVWLAGARFRPTPSAVSGVRPFATFLLGKYLDASGNDDREYDGGFFAIQTGAGIDVRWPGSFQGVRISADFRRVSVADRKRNQFRLQGAYVIGPRRFKPRQ